jgi:hypothetical protein
MIVPAGSGIALVAADHNLVDDNLVTGDNTFRILVANCWAQDVFGTSFPATLRSCA